jgi:transposase
MGEHDTRLWRVLHHYVETERARQDDSKVACVGMDETACRRGNTYVSLFYDMDNNKLLFGTGGKDKATVKAFRDDLMAHGGDLEAIAQTCSDMSPAFISGIKEYLPNAENTFDRFHIMNIINEGVNEVQVKAMREQKDEFVSFSNRTSDEIRRQLFTLQGWLRDILPVENRLEYYEALDTAHTKNDYAPFLALVSTIVELGFNPYWHALGVTP